MGYRCSKCYYHLAPVCGQRKAAMHDCYVFNPHMATGHTMKLKSNISTSITKSLIDELQRRVNVFKDSKSVLSPKVLADYRDDIETLTKLTYS